MKFTHVINTREMVDGCLRKIDHLAKSSSKRPKRSLMSVITNSSRGNEAVVSYLSY